MNILLNDWTHELSDTIAQRYLRTGAFPSCVDSILANGRGRVQCLPPGIREAGPGLGMHPEPGSSTTTSEMAGMSGMSMSDMDMLNNRQMHGMTMDAPMSSQISHASSAMLMDDHTSTMSMESPASTDLGGMPDMPGMDELGPRGCMPPMMFKPGFNSSSLPAETCTNTTSPLLTIPADHSKGWLAMNLVNSGAVSALRVSLDAHSMYVFAADGLFVDLQEIKVGVFSEELRRIYSLLSGTPHGTRSAIFRYGSTEPRTGSLLPPVRNLP